MQHCWEIARVRVENEWLRIRAVSIVNIVRVENEWLRIRAVSFVFIYLDLMRNHSFSTLTMAISQQLFHVLNQWLRIHSFGRSVFETS